MLILFVAGCLAGIGTIIELLAPYSAFGRIATMLLQPLWMLGNNVLASLAEHYESYAFYGVDVWMKSLPVFAIALITLIVLAVLAWRNGRTYCNTICPVGTVLSFISRFSILKIHFDEDKCKNCSLCTKNCKAACIDFKNHQVDYSRCVVCGDCIESCKFGALKYSWKTSQTSKTSETSETSQASVDPSCRPGSGSQACGWWPGRYHREEGPRAPDARGTSWCPFAEKYDPALHWLSALRVEMS